MEPISRALNAGAFPACCSIKLNLLKRQSRQHGLAPCQSAQGWWGTCAHLDFVQLVGDVAGRHQAAAQGVGRSCEGLHHDRLQQPPPHGQRIPLPCKRCQRPIQRCLQLLSHAQEKKLLCVYQEDMIFPGGARCPLLNVQCIWHVTGGVSLAGVYCMLSTDWQARC